MTAAEVYESVTNGGSSHFAEVVEILNRRGPWCLIGGLAVNHYVEPVYTVDADVVIIAEHLSAIQDDLAAAGFRVKAFPHSINATKPDSKLSLQFTTAARYQAFIERAELGEVLGQTIPIASLPDLIQGKLWAWNDASRRPSKRLKDELDLVRVAEKHPEFRPLMPHDVTKRLEGPQS